MSEEEKRDQYSNNPWNKPKLNIPVSSLPSQDKNPEASETKKGGKTFKKKDMEEDAVDDLNISALNILMAPTLHKKFKLRCTIEGISMKKKVLDFIKKEVEKD
jgi:hypothetical protein